MDIIIRSALAFLFIWGMFRVMGRRELAQLSAFELVVLLVVGNLIQQGITGRDQTMVGGLSAAATMALLALLFTYLSFRSAKARRLLEGDPVTVVDDGEVDRETLHRQRFSLEDLKTEARLHGIEDLSVVQAAVLEPDGRVSFIRKDVPGESEPVEQPIG